MLKMGVFYGSESKLKSTVCFLLQEVGSIIGKVCDAA